ncbi:hypothetical protein [Ensifer sp. SSB1]|uniref:hypothetical protein n=1 Tax=Ensifer sp. SSB1 TaxID=2795385 RepID=UPI001A4A51A1|nr:hypothetical protein [Ensifer sp. SSB1]MBK5570112.1 hypothetical protein [Ensifer sp. SSB1]
MSSAGQKLMLAAAFALAAASASTVAQVPQYGGPAIGDRKSPGRAKRRAANKAARKARKQGRK